MYVCIYIYTYIHTHTCTRTHTHTHTHTHTRHTCFRASAKSLTFWSTSARSATSCFCLIFSLSSIASVLFSFFFAIKKVSSCLTQKKKTRMATDWLDLQSVFHCICVVSNKNFHCICFVFLICVSGTSPLVYAGKSKTEIASGCFYLTFTLFCITSDFFPYISSIGVIWPIHTLHICCFGFGLTSSLS